MTARTARGLSVDLAEAYARAGVVTRERAKNFYYGLRLTPEPRRSAVYAVYAWMRAGDDAVDDAPTASARHAALAELREATGAALAGDGWRGCSARAPLGGVWWHALVDTIERHRLPASIFTDTLDGLEADTRADAGPPADIVALEAYCRRVAGTAGRACVRIWGSPGWVSSSERVELDSLADELGIAFQVTNILRDIGEDAQPPINRVYVPASVLNACDVTMAELLAWRDDRRCRAVVLTLAERAARAFGAAEVIAPRINPECRATLGAMTGIYRRILDQIIADPRRAVAGPGRRARVATWQKLTIMLRALASRTISEAMADRGGGSGGRA
jgi:phytoene synthase